MGRNRWVAVRQAESAPIIRSIRAWLDTHRDRVPPKSPLGEAITYTHNQWTALTRFLDGPRLPLDNNVAERGPRTGAVGRRNWIYAGSDVGAERTATLYSVMVSCRVLGLNPHDYMTDVLGKLPRWPAYRVGELTPRAWAESRGLLPRATDATATGTDPPKG